jgi:hypothetical protein
MPLLKGVYLYMNATDFLQQLVPVWSRWQVAGVLQQLL